MFRAIKNYLQNLVQLHQHRRTRLLVQLKDHFSTLVQNEPMQEWVVCENRGSYQRFTSPAWDGSNGWKARYTVSNNLGISHQFELVVTAETICFVSTPLRIFHCYLFGREDAVRSIAQMVHRIVNTD